MTPWHIPLGRLSLPMQLLRRAALASLRAGLPCPARCLGVPVARARSGPITFSSIAGESVPSGQPGMAGRGAEPAGVDVPRSRSAGAHTFLITEHGLSSIKMGVMSVAALSVLHLGVLDPVTRVESLRTTVHYLSLIWFGAAMAIAFLEAPVKFQAPTLTRPVALDVGRHVFSALNKVEIPAAITLAYAYAFGAVPAGAWALLPAACVAVETVTLMPQMLKRAATVIAGTPLQKSSLHTFTALFICVKVISLMALGLATA